MGGQTELPSRKRILALGLSKMPQSETESMDYVAPDCLGQNHLLTSCVTLRKLLNFTGSQFS